LASGFGGLIPLWHNSPKKEKRASDYWASEQDEYDLPDQETGTVRRAAGVPPEERSDPKLSGFASARLAMGRPSKTSRYGKEPEEMPIVEESPPRPPPGTRLQATKLEYPEPLPFNFGGSSSSTPGIEPAALNFERAHQSSLNLMKSLGLPSPQASSSKPIAPRRGPGLETFQQSSTSALAFMKNLGAADEPPAASRPRTDPLKTAEGSSSYAIPSLSDGVANTVRPSVGGTKRLGMGRPAPWGSKKPKLE
jgi:hypothetical protein